jgi:sarcosine oxidase subunit alpha
MPEPEPISFTFDGRPRAIRPGLPLAPSIEPGRLPTLQRSIRYHRPRAPFCGVGSCTGCLVRVNGVPNVRACEYDPKPGDVVRTENAWPSPRHDLLGAIDLLFRRGLDTLHGFRRPRFAAPLYHRVIRRLAGYGHLADAPPASVPPGRAETTDVLVLGGGPAGRAAARRVAERGRIVHLLDRGDLAAVPAGVVALPRTTAAFLPPPREGAPYPFRLLATRGLEGILLEARTVIVAVGGYDANLLFAGNDRPGVLTGDGALALRDAAGDPPFHRALLLGGGARAATLLERFGPRVEAVAAPGAVHGRIAELAAELDIPVYPRSLLAAAEGRGRVRAATLLPRGGGAPLRIPVDAIVLAARRLPHPQLFFQAGARMHWRGGGGAYYPLLDPSFATSVPGLWAAGECAGFADPVGIEASGIAAAEGALGGTVELRSLPPRVGESGPHELEGAYRELLPQLLRGPKLVVCPCEDVLLSELAEAHARGYRGIEVVKRYTALGTGLCQGRYCLPDALLLLSIWEGRPPSEVGYITQRPPVVPTRLAALAALPADGEALP